MAKTKEEALENIAKYSTPIPLKTFTESYIDLAMKEGASIEDVKRVMGSLKDGNDNTPLHRLIINQVNLGASGLSQEYINPTEEAIDVLIASGVDVNAVNKNNETTLNILSSSQMPSPGIAQKLVSKGAMITEDLMSVKPERSFAGESPDASLKQDTKGILVTKAGEIGRKAFSKELGDIMNEKALKNIMYDFTEPPMPSKEDFAKQKRDEKNSLHEAIFGDKPDAASSHAKAARDVMPSKTPQRSRSNSPRDHRGRG